MYLKFLNNQLQLPMNTLDSLNEDRYYSTDSLQINGDVRVSRLLTISGDLTINGDVVVDQSLYVRGELSVAGSLSVGTLIVDGAVKIEGTLSASGSVIAGKDIVAETIEAKRIETAGKISADWIFASEFEIVCKQLETRTLPLGRNYWANHPALSEWKEFLGDEKHCWVDFKALAKKTNGKTFESLDFGHWILNAQFRNFVGLEATIPQSEFRGVPKTINEDVDTTPEPEASLESLDVPNYLHDIVKDKKKTPYPDYSGNASYQKICDEWGRDIRETYFDTNVDFGRMETFIRKIKVVDESVKDQLLTNEIPLIQGFRNMINNYHQFLLDVFFDKESRLLKVKNAVKISDDSNTLLDLMKLYTTIIGTIYGPAGAIGSILLSTVSLVEDVKGKIDPIEGKLGEFQTKLTASFEDLLNQYALIATKVIGDYGKLLKVDKLIRTGKLSVTDQQRVDAVKLASDVYERKLWVSILPICWWPTFSYFYYEKQKCSACDNTVYMPHWTECSWGHVTRNSQYIPYWLVCGGGRWWSKELSSIAPKLSDIGISMKSIIRGEGDWGPAFAEYRKHPIGFDQTPYCVKIS